MGSRSKRKSVKPEQATDPDAARAAAEALLARRDFGSGELRGKLQQQGFDPAAAAVAIAELIQAHVLNDTRYADNYVSYHAARGQGPLRIGASLKTLGLARDLIEAALASGPDWRSLARQVRTRKFGPEPPSSWPRKARQARFLQYRGFSSDDIRSALDGDIESD